MIGYFIFVIMKINPFKLKNYIPPDINLNLSLFLSLDSGLSLFIRILNLVQLKNWIFRTTKAGSERSTFFYLLTFFFLIVSIDSAAQTWSPKGATWHYSVSAYGSEGYFKINYTGDTLIGSVTCKILKKTLYFQRFGSAKLETRHMGNEFTYSNANKVYYYRYGKFYILYDFKAKPGDSWVIAGSTPGCDSTSTVKVDSVGCTFVKKKSLTHLRVKALPSDSSTWDFDQKIIQVIGGTNYMFPQQRCNLLANEFSIGPLRCYQDDEGGLYKSTTTTCEYIDTPEVD